MLEGLYRRGLLGLAGARPVSAFIKSQGFKLGVGRFVAGESLEQALPALRTLEQSGLHPILDLLGEFVSTSEGAEAMTRQILKTLERLGGEHLDKTMSVKPTQLGLGVSFELALANARRVAQCAQKMDAHICLDMENAPYVDGTLKLYCALHEDFPPNVSTNVSMVLQSYLRRTQDDLEALLELSPRPELRIVKGAYREGAALAFQDKATVDENYRELVYAGLAASAKINVATHDERILSEVEAYVQKAGLGPERYEFQMLYGVKPALQKRLAERGHVVRVYVPYGQDWYGYFSRRLAERPANLMFVVRGLFG